MSLHAKLLERQDNPAYRPDRRWQFGTMYIVLASASAPFVATLVDVSGIVIYFSVAKVVLAGTLL
jgi:hypothetical protein